MAMLLYIICFAAGLLCTGLSVIREIHMLQLNSYQHGAHLRWMRINVRNYGFHLIVFIVALITFIGHWSVCAVLTVLFLGRLLLRKSRQAKKPLVYTARIKRILLTVTLLAGGFVGIIFVLAAPANYALMGVLYFLAPALVVLANLINAPVEKAVQNYYIRDAQKILQSCPGLVIIGITGSYGKTSVKFYLHTLLQARYHVLMTPESFNTPMGIVRTIREELRATHEVFICEMGARYLHDIREICDIVHPRHGILTSLGPQHLETFGSMENIVATKFELIDSIPPSGMVFINGDNELIRDHLPHKPYLTYGLGEGNRYRACNISVARKGTTFRVVVADGAECDFETQLIGEHNVLNLTGAITCSHYLGVPLEALQLPVRKIIPAPHRLQLIETETMTIIDDTYNSNPAGCKEALKALALFDGDKILITPGMVELGPQHDARHYDFGAAAATVCDFVVLVGEERTRPIRNGLMESGFSPERIYVVPGIKEAMDKAHALRGGADRKIVLLENDLPDNY
jgi:UDP-N-acetylmuramoyl-tripeptide--D-alanyl-D-alanine ligase